MHIKLYCVGILCLYWKLNKGSMVTQTLWNATCMFSDSETVQVSRVHTQMYMFSSYILYLGGPQSQCWVCSPHLHESQPHPWVTLVRAGMWLTCKDTDRISVTTWEYITKYIHERSYNHMTCCTKGRHSTYSSAISHKIMWGDLLTVSTWPSDRF